MKNLKKVLSVVLVIGLTLSAITPVFAVQKTEKLLERLNWAERNHTALNALIQKHSINNDDYDIRNKPYAVFDFDNTTSMNDVEEALLIYQLQNLKFKIPPSKMEDVLKTNVPKDNFDVSWNNAAGKPVNVDLIAIDCATSYAWLYDNYIGLSGDKSLKEIQATSQYTDFTTKVRYLYEAVGDTFSPDISYPWVTYLFYGMTSTEVQNLTKESNEYWLRYDKYKKITWTSPKELSGKAGVVSVSYRTGLRIMPEMIDLYNTMMDNGIEVYVCSASFIDVIVATATDPAIGLNVKPGNVVAMRLKTDDNQKYINKYDNNFFQTQGKGKTQTINKFISPNHEMKDPILVAGDSDGDYYMMKDYPNMEFGLIINRAKGGNIGRLSKIAADAIEADSAKYYLQGRDENTGLFIQSEACMLLGETTEKLIK